MRDGALYRLADVAKACHLDPATLRAWLSEDRIPLQGRERGLAAWSRVKDALTRRGLPLPEDIEPWPKILVVDDQSDTVRVVYWTLETAMPEASVRCALSASEALEQLDSFGPQLLITGTGPLGDIDGFELCRRVASDKRRLRTKILAIGDAGAETRRRALEQGASELLRKPFSQDELDETVRRLLDLPRPAPTA